jgi:cation diffusion facilitator CzcD-associated flavoprotein CzcO
VAGQRYPGCAADMPSFLYCYADRVPSLGAGLVPDRSEILQYLNGVIAQDGLEPHLRFDWPVAAVERHQSEDGWMIRSATGQLIDARVVVIATGTTGAPRTPDLPGIADFKGPLFHTMEWPDTVAVAGRRIAVVGAGASAIQLVPELARQQAEVTVFARTHRWILPKPDFDVNGLWRAALGFSPGLRSMIGERLAQYVDRRASATMFAACLSG